MEQRTDFVQSLKRHSILSNDEHAKCAVDEVRASLSTWAPCVLNFRRCRCTSSGTLAVIDAFLVVLTQRHCKCGVFHLASAFLSKPHSKSTRHLHRVIRRILLPCFASQSLSTTQHWSKRARDESLLVRTSQSQIECRAWAL